MWSQRRMKRSDPNQIDWRQAVTALVLLVGWILFLYRDTGIAMATIWYRSETFTHGFLVPPIALWLIWQRRGQLLALNPQPTVSVLVLIAAAASMWLLGDLVFVNAVTQLALVTLLALTVPVILGLPVANAIRFPLGFLFFCVPIGEFLMPSLMEWTANFTVLALRLSGIPVYREGLHFVIPSGNWSVVEACSGVRYLIASFMVGTLFAYLNYQSAKKRWLFVLVSVLVPLVANWLRAYLIVMLGHLSGNKLAAGVDHLIYGWVFFGFVIMLMFMIGARWADADGQPTTETTPSLKTLPLSTNLRAKLWLVTAGFAALAALPQLTHWLILETPNANLIALSAPVTLTDKWSQTASPAEKIFKPAFQNPSAEVNAIYQNDGRRVGLYIGYYQNQNYERKLVSSNNVLVTSKDADWARASQFGGSLAVDGKTLPVQLEELRTASLATSTVEDRLVVAQIYWIHGTLTTNDYLAKVYSALHRLAGHGDDSAVLVMYVKKAPSDATQALLNSFLADNYVAINALLQNAQSRK
jgi:exosortase A